MINKVNPDQMASLEADLDLHCFITSIYPRSAGQAEQVGSGLTLKP